jgi:hypothetical protein
VGRVLHHHISIDRRGLGMADDRIPNLEKKMEEKIEMKSKQATYCPICRVSLTVVEKQLRCPWCKTFLIVPRGTKLDVDTTFTQT